ncbi:hypothetical protein AVEN_11585-1 [Araneus ventricosus]|uniref:Uncharacterized protein n=1 Tax=Araneus ventricosus TaxID=182803 RepID=A0A4Y2V346_ARAVE|nr:hypothetical protein AVEN_11585-1 [Araneus ventricosus]
MRAASACCARIGLSTRFRIIIDAVRWFRILCLTVRYAFRIIIDCSARFICFGLMRSRIIIRRDYAVLASSGGLRAFRISATRYAFRITRNSLRLRVPHPHLPGARFRITHPGL